MEKKWYVYDGKVQKRTKKWAKANPEAEALEFDDPRVQAVITQQNELRIAYEKIKRMFLNKEQEQKQEEE